MPAISFDGALAVPGPSIADGLCRAGWYVQEQFIPAELSRQLAVECEQSMLSGKMKSAGLGSGHAPLLQPDIRGDHIAWLEAGRSTACDSYLKHMEALRQSLNGELFLGLEEYESHFAVYAPGAFYRAHLDRFRDDDKRTVSVVLYLNDDWLPEHGGALRLHPQDGGHVDIAPVAGRMAMFLSGEMLHEVLPTARQRLSIAGWLRRRA
ncbi:MULTISPECIES: 2OG-Fe(II) oxygenase [unclassified Janthinobacterium]|uniref:2OG-Fe(II) oxygenase n=1 Tax=Janthinobacterium lividum TaxID=29581 RepID=A0A1E8PKA6_9BURK|nr:2OG-Fe(II) oxygenase [Janthinobacterium sp. CG_23.4]MCL6484730.1 2OG-Fe(II) oxygenase [Janthinobacterium lividum]MDH6158317.1 SM-20-related protein [Janthinobacterium sp. CG_23.4]OFJ46778.1 2OG-Fe(II) oxygenase [Janthinobacterium lividum]